MIESGFEVDEGIIKELAELGAPPEVIEGAKRSAQASQDFELFEDCAQSVEVFDAMRTQWDRAGTDGTRVGLKYEVLPQFMRELGVPRAQRNQVWKDVRIMEEATLKFDREKAE